MSQPGNGHHQLSQAEVVEHGNHPGLNTPVDSIAASLTPSSASQPAPPILW